MSHVFGDSVIGDVIGGILGTIVAPGIGTAIGAGLGGAAGSAIGGGNLTQDILGGVSGAAAGYGLGSLAADAGVTGLVGGADAAGAGADATSAATSLAAGVDSSAGAVGGQALTSLGGATDATQAAAGLSGATDATSATVGTGGLATPGASAAAVAPAGTDPLTGASLATDPLTGGTGAVSGGSTGAASALSGTAPTAQTASNGLFLGATNSVPAAGTAPTGTGAVLGGTGPTQGGFTEANVAAAPSAVDASGNIPLPPVPPATTGVGNGIQAVTDAAGNPVYPTAQAAQAASDYTAAGGVAQAQAGGIQGVLNSIGNTLGLTNDAGQATGLGSGLSSGLKYAGIAASGLGLAKDLLQAKQANPISGMSNVQSIAQADQAQSATLENYLNTGTLPPALQASLDQATQQGITAIKNRYAAMGIAPGSTGETQAIAQLQQNAAAQSAALQTQLLSQGISQSQSAASLYNDLVGYNTTLNNQTNQAIGNLASALAGGTKITIGGTNTTTTAQAA